MCKKFHIALFYFACAIMLCSCSEPIDITGQGSNYKSQLVITAMLNNEPARQMVVISRSVPYFSADICPAVNDAEVYISEEGGAEEHLVLNYGSNPGGVYLTRDNFAIKAGKTYHLRVEHEGKTYTATDMAPHNIMAPFCMMQHMDLENDTGKYQPTFMISAAVWREDLKDIHVRVSHRYNGKRMDEKLSEYAVGEVPANYVSNIDEVLNSAGTQIPPQLNELINSMKANTVWAPMLSRAGNGWFTTIENPKDTLYYAPFDTLTLQMHTLSPTLFNYIASLKHESSGGNNPMFGGAPANLASNIEGENATGIFGLYISSSASNMLNYPGSPNIVLPMNRRTLDKDKDWVCHHSDIDSSCVHIEQGRAVYTYPPEKRDLLYFDSIRTDAPNRCFWAKQPADGASVSTRFIMKSYNEFWELPATAGGDTLKWIYPRRKSQESIFSILMILS